MAEKLSSYKKEAGLLVDHVAEAAAQKAYNAGQELMREVRCQQLQQCLLSSCLACLCSQEGRQSCVHTEVCGQHEPPEMVSGYGNVQGKLQEANLAFDEALQHVSFRTHIGGEVTLQKAICLDSLVRWSCTCCPLLLSKCKRAC